MISLNKKWKEAYYMEDSKLIGALYDTYKESESKELIPCLKLQSFS